MSDLTQSRHLRLAIKLLKKERNLPLDLVSHLSNEGIDVPALENKINNQPQ